MGFRSLYRCLLGRLDDLDCEQKKNLKIIGWDQTSWETKYMETDWCDLPPKQKKAAKIAGWTEETWEEDSNEKIDKWWEDLGLKEKQALCVLGWSQETWDD